MLFSLYNSLLLVCRLQVGRGIWFSRRSEAPGCSVCRNNSGYSAEDCYRWTSLDCSSCSLYVSMIEVVFPSDQTFTSFYPEARLPLSLIQGKPVYLEVSLLDPPEPGLVLLVHSCSAFSQTAYPSWMVIYDGCVHKLEKKKLQMIKTAPCVTVHWTISYYFSCPSRRAAQLLPSPNSHHIRRIIVSSFLSPFSESPTSFDKDFPPEDPEVQSLNFWRCYVTMTA